MKNRAITLTTDFGLADPWVGAMKGVLLSRAPSCVIVDLTHGIERHDARAAALALNSCWRFFPKGTIHVAVVDPGVGGSRRIIAGLHEGHFFLAPDTGLAPAAMDLFGRTGKARFRTVENSSLFLPEVSATFHGRDVFAPVAAALAEGLDFGSLGPECPDPVSLTLERPSKAPGLATGVILHVDRFGNLTTNLRLPDLPAPPLAVEVGGTEIPGPARSYASVGAGELLWLVGSAGFLELAVREGSAAERLKAGPGQAVFVRGAAAESPDGPEGAAGAP